MTGGDLSMESSWRWESSYLKGATTNSLEGHQGTPQANFFLAWGRYITGEMLWIHSFSSCALDSSSTFGKGLGKLAPTLENEDAQTTRVACEIKQISLHSVSTLNFFFALHDSINVPRNQSSSTHKFITDGVYSLLGCFFSSFVLSFQLCGSTRIQFEHVALWRKIHSCGAVYSLRASPMMSPLPC